MDKLESYLKIIDFDSSRNLVTEDFIKNIESKCGVKIGIQLRKYLLKYGYLGYRFLEFYGVNSKQGLESDLVKQTLYLHKYFEITKPYYSFANEGDGEYILINSDDKVFSFDSDFKKILSKNILLEDFIIESFKQVDM